MPKPIIVAVVGSTGKQGRALARLLLHRGHTVRALTRHPTSPVALALRNLGAEIWQADLEDYETIRRAADGSDSFFLMATPYEAGTEAEVRQARQAARAAKEAGVKHLVYSSVASADQNTGIPHFESKGDVEGYIRKLHVPYTIVAPVFFMENLLGPMFIEGLSPYTLSMPLPPSRPLQTIAVEDIAEFVALALERPGEFQDKRIDIASDSLSGLEMAAALAQASGRDISYGEGPLEAVRAESRDLARMWEWFYEKGYSVNIYDLVRAYPDVGWHSFLRWAHEQDWSKLDRADSAHSTT